MKRTPCTAALAVAFLSMLVAMNANAQNAPTDVVVADGLGETIDRYLATLAVYGMSGSMLVEHNGKVLLHRSYGLADRAAGIDLSPGMPMPIGSLSKQFVAAAILRLEAQGLLRVQDSLPQFFDAVPRDKRSITLHHLLTHTAGLAYLPPGDPFEQMSREEVMRSTLELPLTGAVGGPHAYANTGYTLLAGVIERVSGMPHEEYIRRELFAPAGMRDSGFESDTAAAWRARLGLHSYSGNVDEGPASGFPVAARLIGAGGVVSTVADLYRWELALRGSSILPDSSRRKLFTPHVDAGGPARHAYGWNVITTIRGTTLIAHAGDIGGYNADFRRYVDEGLTLIFLSNARTSGGGYRQAVMNNVSLIVAGAPYNAPPAVSALDSAALGRFAARYELPNGERLRLWIAGAHAMIGAEGAEGIMLIGGGDSSSAATVDARTLSIARDIVAGEHSSLARVLTPSLPLHAVRTEIMRRIAELSDSLGAVRRPDVLGTAILSPVAARTYWRLTFERGSVMQEWAWQGETIVALDEAPHGAIPTLLAPVSSTQLASFDPFTGRSISVSLVDGGIRVATRERTVEARRVGDS